MKKIFFLTTIILTTSFALAHERQVFNIGGTDYLFTVGSLNEPIVVGDKSGLDLRVTLADKNDFSTTTSKANVPVLGLDKTLKIENISGNAKKEFALTSAWGKPGNYTTTFYPTDSDIFSYRIFGEINNTPVDLKFTCNPKGHVMNESKMEPMADGMMENGAFEMEYMSGSFGCALDKGDLLFPGGNSWKDTLKNNLFGIVALALLLTYIAQNRKRS